MWRKAVPAQRGDSGRRFFLMIVPVLVVAGFLLWFSSGRVHASVAQGEARQAGATGCGWGLTTSLNQNIYNEFNGIGGTSPTDIWGVGSRGDGDVKILTLIEHWDGTSWSIVPSPSPGPNRNSLFGVAAISANDVWAVGYADRTMFSDLVTVVLHWDGSAWTQVPSPSPGSWESALYGVAAISTNNVWAVGYARDSVNYRTLVEHWDGSNWSVVPSPNFGTGSNQLASISALSANDIWTVGDYGAAGGSSQTLIEHWDGATWSIAPSPNVPSVQNHLAAVSAVAPSDSWAVGYSCSGNCFSTAQRSKLALHWDGSAWNIVNLPASAGDSDYFLAVVAQPNDVWAMGEFENQTIGQTLAMHWDGSGWSQAPSPDPTNTFQEFRAVTALPGGQLWASGAYHFPGNPVFRTLSSRFLGPCGPATSTPTASATATTTSSATSTATHEPTETPTVTETTSPVATLPPATSSPTSTATACAIGFSDVQPTDYFYQAVTYLACHGAISGYSDGSFRPFNNTTRGQLCKIVVLAEGWDINTTGGPHFTDVPPSNAFYGFVETAFHHEVISGYADGTFGWGNNVTRGQLCKIVVIAQGWQLQDPTSPTFSDVPSGSAFYEYVETAYAHGIVSGYADATFRPGNPATRGQISKIVFGAVSGQ